MQLKQKNVKALRLYTHTHTHTNSLRKEKGITLIALVITIIVLLILAGVTIAALSGDNGILQRASEAKEQTQIQTDEELRRLTQMEAAMNLENQLYKDKNEDTVTIPAGFAVSQVEGENTIENGLVIIDKNGNEFVWVPVEITEEEKQAGVTFESKYPRTEFSNNAPTNNPPTTETSTDFAEPYVNGYDGEYEEYQDMINSVTEHGGFYVGRYEAGCGIERNNANKTTKQTVLVKKGVYVYNYVPWGNEPNDIGITTGHGTTYDGIIGAVELSKNFSKENGYDTNQITSTLIYGIQWDMMLRYVADENHNVNNSSNWGNYNNSTGAAATNCGPTNMNFTTGRNEAWKAKNIYDIAGNEEEWTMETIGSGVYMGAKIPRGGYFNHEYSSHPASFRGNAGSYVSNSNISFRIALYIK